MLITIDSGNTRQRYAWFAQNQLQQFGDLSDLNADHAIAQVADVDAIASAVKPFAWPVISQQWHIHHFPIRQDGENFLDMPVRYSASMGQDRLACCYLAYNLYAAGARGVSLVIDAGTFTTVDIVDRNGHQGGFILPGDDLLADSYTHGNLLHRPLLQSTSIQDTLARPLPDSTELAMELGINSMLASFYQLLQHRFNPGTIYVTGGARQHHVQLLTRKILGAKDPTVINHPALLHFGLFLTAQKIIHATLPAEALEQIAQQVGLKAPGTVTPLRPPTTLHILSPEDRP